MNTCSGTSAPPPWPAPCPCPAPWPCPRCSWSLPRFAPGDVDDDGGDDEDIDSHHGEVGDDSKDIASIFTCSCWSPSFSGAALLVLPEGLPSSPFGRWFFFWRLFGLFSLLLSLFPLFTPFLSILISKKVRFQQVQAIFRKWWIRISFLGPQEYPRTYKISLGCRCESCQQPKMRTIMSELSKFWQILHLALSRPSLAPVGSCWVSRKVAPGYWPRHKPVARIAR